MSASTYPLADALSAIRNCVNIRVRRSVSIPYSRFVLSVIEVMKSTGYVKDVSVVDISPGVKRINVLLALNSRKCNILSSVKLFSKPGCRIYSTVRELKAMRSRDSIGVVIISTPRGVMTISRAISESLGGEVLCKLFD